MHLLKFLPLLPLAACWGELGHRTVAYLAQRHLTAPVRLWVDYILQGKDISEAAIWPDEIKNRTIYGDKYAYTTAWHFYNVAGSFAQHCKLKDSDIPAACKAKGCALDAIANHTERVENTTLSITDRNEAMKFVMHIIGDLHQPLHTEATAKGGNGLCVKWGKGRHAPGEDFCSSSGLDNMHNVWDDFIPETLIQEKYNITSQRDGVAVSKWSNKFKEAAYKWSEKLFDANDLPEVCPYDESDKCAFSWAQESNEFVCSNVLANDGTKEGADLSTKYYNTNKEIVEAQVKRAGLRLAAWINRMALASPLLHVQTELKRREE